MLLKKKGISSSGSYGPPDVLREPPEWSKYNLKQL